MKKINLYVLFLLFSVNSFTADVSVKFFGEKGSNSFLGKLELFKEIFSNIQANKPVPDYKDQAQAIQDAKDILSFFKNNKPLRSRISKMILYRENLSEYGLFDKNKLNLKGDDALKQLDSQISQKDAVLDKYASVAPSVSPIPVAPPISPDSPTSSSNASNQIRKLKDEIAQIRAQLKEGHLSVIQAYDDLNKIKSAAQLIVDQKIELKNILSNLQQYIDETLKNFKIDGLTGLNIQKIKILSDAIAVKVPEKKGVFRPAMDSKDISIYEKTINSILSRYEKLSKPESSSSKPKEEVDTKKIKSLISEIEAIISGLTASNDKNDLVRFTRVVSDEEDSEDKIEKLEALLEFAKRIKDNKFLALGASRKRFAELGIS